MTSIARSLAILIAAAVPSVSMAAEQADPGITVQGKREDAPSTTAAVRAISDAVDGVLPRFEKPVCPAAVGLPRRLGAGVVARMRESIAEAGVELEREGCGANLTLIVADDGAALIDSLAQKSPLLFTSLTAQDIRNLTAAPGPVRAWQATEPKRADGAPVVRNSGGGSDTYFVQGAKMSRLSSPIRMDVSLGFVVIDTAAIDGLEVRQIADFAVMRGLAPTRHPTTESVGYRSILDLFSDTGRPDGLTEFDRIYLHALYSGGNGLTYAQKTKQIAGQVDRAAGEQGR